jgi:serine protease AprX
MRGRAPLAVAAVVLLTLLSVVGHAGARTPLATGLDPVLVDVLAATPPGQDVAVVATLRDPADRPLPRGQVTARTAVVHSLRTRAARTQAALLGMLTRDGASAVTPLWIRDQVAFRASAGVVRRVAARPDVELVALDEAPITPGTVPAAATAATSATPVGWGVSAVGAPNVWATTTGAGAVVADLDTGVDVTAPDLAATYRGGAGSWFDPYNQHATPTDVNGHGTWTTSIMTGGSNTGTAVGVAPGAHWIAARVFDDSGRATTSAIHAAFQWALTAAPQVVNASWTSTSTTCSTEFEADLAALRAVGTLTVVAAGNSGPAAGSGTAPATLPEAVAVGSVDQSSVVDPSSSRGPAPCAGRTTFPDLVAPGVAVPVTDLGGYPFTASGTSMAAPHVAGVLALLAAAHPGLSADAQEQALLGGARDVYPPGPDSASGAGEVDAAQSMSLLGTSPPPPPPPADTVPPTVTNVGATPAVGSVTLSATAADAGTGVVGASAWVDTDPGIATRTALVLTPRSTGTWDVSGTIPTPGFPAGNHTLHLTVVDGAGNTTTVDTVLVLPAPDTLFRDGVESGTLGAWPVRTGSGPTVTTAAALSGRYGMEQVPARTASTVFTPDLGGGTTLDVELLLDANGLTGTGSTLTIAALSTGPTTAVQVSVSLRVTSTGRQVRVTAGTQTTPWLALATGRATRLELAGSWATHQLVVQLDTVTKANLGGLTGSSAPRVLGVGQIGSAAATMGGRVRLDAIVITRASHIGATVAGL